MTLQPRAVLIHRRSEYDEMIRRHGTRQQAAFFLDARGGSIDDLADRNQALTNSIDRVVSAIPPTWRRATVERSDLDRFDFTDDDIVIVVGQDGLVANVSKYLDTQPVIGINPEPERNPGVLVPHRAEAIASLLSSAVSGKCQIERRTMVTARTDEGHELHALNEVYFGHRGHQSARYRLVLGDGSVERQSSSGVLVGTGTGATGWLRSAWQERRSSLALPAPCDQRLCWFVREAWPSIATGTDNTEGLLDEGDAVVLYAESDELVCFGDGIESDALRLFWGQALTITVATRALHLVR